MKEYLLLEYYIHSMKYVDNQINDYNNHYCNKELKGRPNLNLSWGIKATCSRFGQGNPIALINFVVCCRW